MPKVLDVIANSLNADLQRFNNVSHNIANVNTAGFKSIDLVTKTTLSNINDSSLESRINFTNGNITKTERSLDFAITGNGFFLVQTPAGEHYITRNGSFIIDNDMNLTTKEGYLVMGDQGAIQLSDNEINIDQSGNFLSKGQITNSFKIVLPNDLNKVDYIGASLFKIASGNDYQDTELKSIEQGALESSNISSSAQMVELIQLSRHMQSIQKAMQAYDHILNSGINTLGQR